MSLPQRKIGTVPVGAIGYGAMGIAAYYGKPLPDEERLRILDAVYKSGCTYWDTANVYKDSEVVIGKWFKETGKRNEIFIATKCGFVFEPNRLIKGEPDYVKECCVRSMERLGVDHTDLYYLHRADPLVPIERTVGAMAELVKEGKVKYLGLSEVSASTLRRAYAVHPIAAVQVEYSPFTLDAEDPKIGLFAACKELGVTIIAYSPLGRGLLTGQYKGPEDFDEDDFRRRIPRYSKENFPNILKISDGLKGIGERHGATAGQVSLAWILAQADNIIPIPGTTRVPALKENVAAAQVTLTSSEIEEVRTIAKAAEYIRGERYPPGFTQYLFAETPAL